MPISKGDTVLFNLKRYSVIWVYKNGYIEIREQINDRNIEVVPAKEVCNITKKDLL
jgi:hypothetical protein